MSVRELAYRVMPHAIRGYQLTLTGVIRVSTMEMERYHGNRFLIPVASVSIFSYPEYLLGYVLDDRGIRFDSGQGEGIFIFSKLPGWLWTEHSPLYNE